MKQKQNKQAKTESHPSNAYPPNPKDNIEKELLEEIVEKQKLVKKK